MLDCFRKKGKASFVTDGQWGSAGKGAAVAFMTTHMAQRGEAFDIITTNNGAQSGHTSVHGGVTRVQFHLPTAAVWNTAQPKMLTYLNGGAVIDPVILLRELDDNPHVLNSFAIHPNAAVITEDCRAAEMRDDSAQTKIASTRKGVGEALSRKVLRSGMIAKDHPVLSRWVRRIDLNEQMQRGASVLVEVPQGHSLSLDGPFYPHTTSRNCTVGQAMSDAGIHPHFYHASMMVIRTFPIRVGNIYGDWRDQTAPCQPDPSTQIGFSGGHFPDQHEISWADLGVKAETTTVTKRVRRVFTFSEQQVAEAIAQTRPSVIYLTFCDYLPAAATRELDLDDINNGVGKRLIARKMVDRLREMCNRVGSVRHDGPEILTQWGPTTADVIRAEDL